MPETDKMSCPDCGVEMNRHAEKIDYSATLAEPDAAGSFRVTRAVGLHRGSRSN